MSRPNILFVFADQLRYSAVGCSHNAVVRTPHLDRLAAEGIIFDQAFSGYPLCTPYRGALLTGRYAHQNGALDNEYMLWRDQITLPQVLKEAGYHTGFIGKWHLGYGPYPEEKRYGFDYMAAYNIARGGYWKNQYHENERGPIPFGCWSPAGEVSLVIRFMEEHQRQNDGAPFAVVLAWEPPHWPYNQFPEEFNTYDPASVDVPPNVPVQMEAFARKEIALYYGCVTALDAQMGCLLAALDRLGLAEKTIVVFTSDHGDHLSSHGFGKPWDQWLHHTKRCSKASPYEEAIHVPFLLRYPAKVRPGQRTRALLNTVDIMPTLLSLCELAIPGTVRGMDLSHAVLGQEGPWADSVYLQNEAIGWPNRTKWLGFWRGVRTERWVYARWRNHEVDPLLFDRENDPHEMRNLAGNKEYSDVEA
ncbi:MAG: sulfatase, partial [Anaerolineae bacterium]|nr:sulfatase [Anaerolineae bacterium]